MVVLPKRPRLFFVDVDVRDKREPPHPVVRLEDVASILTVGVLAERALVLATRDVLALRVEETRERRPRVG